ncbi:MAG: hypothetical protein R3C49_21645 [Planctomycetaceae bacterium]
MASLRARNIRFAAVTGISLSVPLTVVMIVQQKICLYCLAAVCNVLMVISLAVHAGPLICTPSSE